MISKLERTQSTAEQTKDLTLIDPHKQREQQQPKNKQEYVRGAFLKFVELGGIATNIEFMVG